MATILLSAAGAAVGAGFGGSVLGLSGAVIGRAIGATVGRVIDQRILGSGSRAVETGRVDRFRMSGASEGAPVGVVWGRMRVGGQVIWSSRFLETKRTSGGGKGAPKPKVSEYSYSVSIAVALCEGEITRVGRLWADGAEISPDDVTMRVYTGSETQMPDPKMEAVEGAGLVPAYRGIAYVVFEDLALAPFGNRVPQFSFEVIRPAQGEGIDDVPELTRGIRGVALIPGTGEYALATTPVHFALGLGQNTGANQNGPGGGTDFTASMRMLDEELPNCGSVSLVVSWFGDDLRCGSCAIRPKVEQVARDGQGMAWRAGGIGRAQATPVVQLDGRPAFGGTPADQSVIEAIRALRGQGKSVVFYPFILMEQLSGNGQPDPWTGAADQPVLPWRGRITTSKAPGQAGTPDRTAQAAAEVASFFGLAGPGDFSVSGSVVNYAGPAEWSYRRFILHCAHLCAAAGGVDGFCIGSEMRALTQVRGTGDTFPAVMQLKALAADVRAILGPGVRIGYAADWSEYFGYQTPEGDLRYHLDPLWADANVDFVGIDNYMPLSDWRDGVAHADAAAGAPSIFDLGYLQGNIEGGEGYDWYYASSDHRVGQRRTPITDGYGEPWVWRYKDIRNWWANAHHERLGGVRAASPTVWVPESKPIWFTEYGCPAVDKGTNEPNRFIDPKSSESAVPHFSDGSRDDLIQMQYLRAVADYWSDPARNPLSAVYGGPMIDMARAHVWAWDTRPYPQFPSNAALWSDGANYRRGHWVSGRTTVQPLASVVAEICARAGVAAVDVSKLWGTVRGYVVSGVEPGRASLQPMMLAYGFDAIERDGQLVFRMRDGRVDEEITADDLAVGDETDGWVEATRATEAEMAGRVRLAYVEAEGDFGSRAVEAIFPDEATRAVTQSEIGLALTRSEAQATVERWLSEARVARDMVRLALPPSKGHLGAGDVLRVPDAGLYRIDRVEQAGALAVEAVRVEDGIYMPSDEAEEVAVATAHVPLLPVAPFFMDLPLMSGSEVPHAPHLAVAAVPWPGRVTLWSSDQDAGYVLNTAVTTGGVVGTTELPVGPGRIGVWDRGGLVRVRLGSGALASVGQDQLLNGANLIALGDGSNTGWELIQFRDATLVAPQTYELRLLLRGQAGTENIPAGGWPAGSIVVLMDGAPQQIALTLAERDLARHYRIGPAGRPYDDASYVHRIESFPGVGLRPYAPVHVRARRSGADLGVAWVRRTRIGGDSWSGIEVPLGEAAESYRVRVMQGGGVLREATVAAPGWTYASAEQALDGVVLPFEIHVAQLSDQFGAGPFGKVTVNV